MLNRIIRAATIGTVTAVFVLGWSVTASADEGTGTVNCDKNPAPACDLEAATPAHRGPEYTGGNAAAKESPCRNPEGVVIACERDGAWAGSDGCYYKPADLSAETVAGLGGQPAGEGGWYLRTCYGPDGGGLGGPVWIEGTPPVVSPEVLARQARARLELPGVRVSLSPAARQLTHFPTWLTVDPWSWQPRSATASVPGVSVTATARPTKATWWMGDHFFGRPQGVVVCSGPGTPFRSGMDPAGASPDCGYTYRRSSAGGPGERFTVTVTIAWKVTWAGAGQSGTVPGLTTTGSVQVPVEESHALVT
jgi:hypothetical protein